MSRRNLLGQVLGGRYRIDEILGQGGMSAVYKAYDPNLKRVVAVKTIHSHLASDPRFLVRFEEEATAVAQLRHPNIVQVFDFSHDDDLYYMVQEYVPGETLQERLRRLSQAGKRLALDEAIRYALNVCDAAGYAHRHGMVHRDIKPANIMLDVHGQAILMDFGIVKIAGNDSHTATGAVVGTAVYMAPEMIRGESPDPRSDLYSLAVTLFEMVSGRPPFEADSAMTLMMMHLQDPVPDLRELRQGLPEELVAVVEKALAKDRDGRYASMADLAAALGNVQDRPRSAATLQATQVEGVATGTPPTEVEEVPLKGGAVGRASPPSSPREEAGGPASEPFLRRGEGGLRGEARPSQPALPPARARRRPLAAWAGGAVVLMAIVAVGLFLALRPSAGSDGPVTQAPAATLAAGDPTEASVARQATLLATSTPGAAAALQAATAPTEEAPPAPTPSAASATSESPAPQPISSPTPAASPTPAIPSGVPFAHMKGITRDNQQRYVVEYETFEFTEELPGVHLHFFFNTVPQEQAGVPGKGEWVIYGGPRPFAEIEQSARPANASQMCVLVANADHSVQLESGTCAVLPDVVTASPVQDAACRQGPGTAYPALAQLPAWQVTLVRGIAPDESWWQVANPLALGESCWLPLEATAVTGDISTLPLAEVPPLPAGVAGADRSVLITAIGLDSQGRYAVEFETQGFEPQLPGTHIHFFFDDVPPDQVGISGSGLRRMHGGPSPFTGYAPADRPAAAAQLCALVANPDHSVVLGSGNCFTLPVAP